MWSTATHLAPGPTMPSFDSPVSTGRHSTIRLRSTNLSTQYIALPASPHTYPTIRSSTAKHDSTRTCSAASITETYSPTTIIIRTPCRRRNWALPNSTKLRRTRRTTTTVACPKTSPVKIHKSRVQTIGKNKRLLSSLHSGSRIVKTGVEERELRFKVGNSAPSKICSCSPSEDSYSWNFGINFNFDATITRTPRLKLLNYNTHFLKELKHLDMTKSFSKVKCYCLSNLRNNINLSLDCSFKQLQFN